MQAIGGLGNRGSATDFSTPERMGCARLSGLCISSCGSSIVDQLIALQGARLWLRDVVVWLSVAQYSAVSRCVRARRRQRDPQADHSQFDGDMIG
jgi:hypothetical protein